LGGWPSLLADVFSGRHHVLGHDDHLLSFPQASGFGYLQGLSITSPRPVRFLYFCFKNRPFFFFPPSVCRILGGALAPSGVYRNILLGQKTPCTRVPSGFFSSRDVRGGSETMGAFPPGNRFCCLLSSFFMVPMEVPGCLARNAANPLYS